MSSQKVICRLVWTRQGVADFAREVNSLLLEGFVVRDLSISPGWLRILCLALLESEDDS